MSSTADDAEFVEFRDERWFVADARFDTTTVGGSEGHWHLTLTGPFQPEPNASSEAAS